MEMISSGGRPVRVGQGPDISSVVGVSDVMLDAMTEGHSRASMLRNGEAVVNHMYISFVI